MATRLAHPDPAEFRRLQTAYQQSLRCAAAGRRLYQQLQRTVCQSLLGLANALEARDPYTRGHSKRVSALSRRIAVRLGLDPVDVAAVTEAALLHDIGKIAVTEPGPRKPGALGVEEWLEMRRHPVVGAQIVAPFEFLAARAPLIRHHHERWDGSGYPDGLVGDAIPPGARIVAVADVLDALTSDRPHRPAVSRAAALRHLEHASGRELDPAVVSACLAVLEPGDP
jgi:putative nucleotidyltransferase with HDIG domain